MDKSNRVMFSTNNKKKKIKKMYGVSVLVIVTFFQANFFNGLFSSQPRSFFSNFINVPFPSTEISVSSKVDSRFILYAKADLNFISLGNWGYESTHRQEVMNTLKKKAEEESITFVVSPGSNFYGGVTGLDDKKWKNLYESPFNDDFKKSLKVPFFTVLGSEDWTGNYTSEILRSHNDYDNSLHKNSSYPIWTLPNWWYHYVTSFVVSAGPNFLKSGHKDMRLAIAFIDTFIMSEVFPFTNITKKAWADLENTLSNAAKMMDYIIVVGDKAMYTSGKSKGDSFLRYYLEPILKKYNVDAYISGSDFSLEVLEKENITHINCGSTVVSGGSQTKKPTEKLYYTESIGFCVHQLTASGMRTKIIDGLTGEELFAKKHELQKRNVVAEVLNTKNGAGDAFHLPKVEYFPVPMIERNIGSKDLFVKVVGTFGLTILSIFIILILFILASKATKN